MFEFEFLLNFHKKSDYFSNLNLMSCVSVIKIIFVVLEKSIGKVCSEFGPKLRQVIIIINNCTKFRIIIIVDSKLMIILTFDKSGGEDGWVL